MALTSSPVLFPPSSSPAKPPQFQQRKRSNLDDLPRQSKRRWADLIKANSFEQGKENVPPQQEETLFESPWKDDTRPAPSHETADDEWDPFERPDQRSSSSKSSRSQPEPNVSRENVFKKPQLYSSEFATAASGDGCGLFKIRTASQKLLRIRLKPLPKSVSYEELIASRSSIKAGRATRSYYGIDVHELLENAAKNSQKTPAPEVTSLSEIRPSIETPGSSKRSRSMLWTEKYRARKFTDLVGDERTHRQVLRWIKGWDPIVFPGISKPKSKFQHFGEGENKRQQRKILLVTGPPGLGKTTLAHVCAKQAGYEVAEINASDERSRDVVKGRIRDIMGTENVKGVNTKEQGQTVRKAARPVCVVVDEVDGVVGGSGGGGEGGFIKALVDLLLLDQRNSLGADNGTGAPRPKRAKKGDQFRMLRPMILICNDVYHPSLRPLRSSSLAETIHIRKPPLEKVVARIKFVFEKEGIPCENDGARRLCEAAWGISNRRDSHSKPSTGDGDLRGILVIGEWVAAKLRASECSSATASVKLTRRWVEQNLLDSLSHGGSGARGLGRGGTKEAVERVFLEGAGFSKGGAAAVGVHVPEHSSVGSTLHVSEPGKEHAMNRLREVVDTSGEVDRIVSDCFATYPSQPFQDDTYLSKPATAYEWLHFHDTLSSKVYSHQEWELNPYLAHSVLGFHDLFASPARHTFSNDHNNNDNNPEAEDSEPLPFSGPRAAYSAHETFKQNHAILTSMHASSSIPVFQSFRSPEAIATDLAPYLNSILSPNVNPIIVGGSGENRGVVTVRKDTERAKIERAAAVMAATGVGFERCRLEGAGGFHGGGGQSSYVYRMEPPIDSLAAFETASSASIASGTTTRYAVRQALDQEHQKYIQRKSAESRREKYRALNPGFEDIITIPSTFPKENNPDAAKLASAGSQARKLDAVKRDFFGRIIQECNVTNVWIGGSDSADGVAKKKINTKEEEKVWVSFHEGYSNAVRKPITLEELMRGF